MQKVIYRNEIEQYEEQIDQIIINHIEEGLVETFEGFEHFSLVAFDWYDISNIEQEPSQMIIYLDEEDFFVICENEVSYKAAKTYLVPNNYEKYYKKITIFFVKTDVLHNKEEKIR